MSLIKGLEFRYGIRVQGFDIDAKSPTAMQKPQRLHYVSYACDHDRLVMPTHMYRIVHVPSQILVVFVCFIAGNTAVEIGNRPTGQTCFSYWS